VPVVIAHAHHWYSLFEHDSRFNCTGTVITCQVPLLWSSMIDLRAC
jgi:hypothetical protein